MALIVHIGTYVRCPNQAYLKRKTLTHIQSSSAILPNQKLQQNPRIVTFDLASCEFICALQSSICNPTEEHTFGSPLNE